MDHIPDDLNLFGPDSDVTLNLSPLNIGSINPDQQLPPSCPDSAIDQGRRLRLRNRNPRSCDFCRSRKTACIIEAALPCAACRARGLQCTFAQPRRRRPMPTEGAGLSTFNNALGGDLEHSANWPTVSSSSAQQPMTATPWPVALGAMDTLPMDTSFLNANPVYSQGQGFMPSPNDDEAQDSDDSDGSDVSQTNRNAMQLPLDQPAWTYMLLGESGEGDPHLLRRTAHAVHADNIHFRRFPREVNAGEDLDQTRPIVYMLGRDSLYDKYEPRVEDSTLKVMREELEQVSHDVGVRLVNLYFKYIYPYFPILSRSYMLADGHISEATLASLPLSLKAVLYASSLPYTMYDDVLSTMLDVSLPTAKSLYRICWTAITQEIHTPRLSTLQACLLLLQRDNIDRYVQGSPFQWSLMAWTISLAQTLGLGTDCSTVRGMPAWEKRLRKRLWWATYILDKWYFATAGLASHIHEDDYDVLPMTDSDSSSTNGDDQEDETHSLPNFRQLIDLTHLLSSITKSFFTVRSSRSTSSDYAKTVSLANDIQSRLYAWKASLDTSTSSATSQTPASRTRLDGNGSLILAYWTAHLLVVRAILRALEGQEGTEEDKKLRREGRQTARLGAEECCGKVVDFVDGLQAGAWNAFCLTLQLRHRILRHDQTPRHLYRDRGDGQTQRLDRSLAMGSAQRWRKCRRRHDEPWPAAAGSYASTEPRLKMPCVKKASYYIDRPRQCHCSKGSAISP
ncbi:fungal specific transcription factor domain-containing protein [Sarocladium implicatum]|nr:fungal specific transcription factor domain-containing protein [Sarocladium implicatum]